MITNQGAMAHLGARQTEDLEVAGSSPACPILFFVLFSVSLYFFEVWILAPLGFNLHIVGEDDVVGVVIDCASRIQLVNKCGVLAGLLCNYLVSWLVGCVPVGGRCPFVRWVRHHSI